MDQQEFNKRWNEVGRSLGLVEPVREGVLTELGQGAALGAVSGLRGFASTLEELGGPAGPRKYFDAVLATNRQWNPDPDYTALSLNPANIARAVGTGAGQTATLLPAIAAGSAVGGPVGTGLVGAAVFAQTYGDNLKDYRERFKDRYSENEIRAMSFGRTLVDSAIETGLGSVPLAGKSIRTLINGRAADAVARNAIKEASKKFGKETVVKALNNGFTRAVGKGALGEGGEEALQYVQDLIWRSVAGDPSAVLNWGELAENAAAGAWAGAAFGAIDAGTGRMAQRDRRAAMPPIDVAEAVSPAWMKHYNVKDDSGAELAGLAASMPEGMSPADFTIVQPKSRAAKAVDAIGRELGLDIRYFVPMSENGAALNGVFARDSDAIYLDAAGTSRNPMQSLGHEFAHYLGKQAPDLADVWEQALNSAANPEARAAEETALRETYGELGEAGAEFSADRMGDMFTDPGMWARAVQLAEAKQAGFGAKLLKVIDRFISAVKRQLVKFKSSEVEKFITDMDAAREAAAGVVAEFKRRQAGMLVPVEEHGQARTSTEAGTLPPFEAFRELRRQQAEEAGRMAGMLVPAGTQETTTEDAPVISPAPKIPAYTAERQAERASLEKFQKDGARIDKMLTAFEKYDERTGALADSQFVERNGRLLAEVEDAIRKNNPGLVQEKLNILAKRVRNWASKRRKPEAVSEPGGKVPPPDMRANALRGRAEEREREAKPNDLPEVSTDRADNIYLRMPLERVRQDAAHGVKLAQEALKELEAQETAAEPEPAAEIPAITEDEFLASRGVGAPVSDYLLDKLRANKSLATERGRKRFLKEAAEAQKSHAEAREQVRKEYRELVDSGKIRNKTAIEQSLTTAHGHPDLESTQAARRILAKKGIDWKTGEKITSEKPEPAPEIARLAGVGSTAEIVERLKNGERLTIETKVKTDAGPAENISIYASRRPDGRFSIVTGRGNGADNLTAAQLRKKLDRMKFENPEESSARFEPAEKREAAVPAKKNAVSERVLYHWDHNGEWNNKGKNFSELMEGFVAMMDAGKELLVDTARGRYKFHKKAGEYEGVFPSGKVQRYSYDELYGKFAGWITGGKPNNRFLVEESAASVPADYKTWDDNGNWKLSKSSGEIAEDFIAALDAGKRLEAAERGVIKQGEKYQVHTPAGKIYSFSREGIGKFLVDWITSDDPTIKIRLAEESAVPEKPAKKAEYSLSRKPESIQDFREMPAHPRPERAKFGNLRELYDIYKREYLGKTFTAASGHTIMFKPGHFFRLIAGTPAGGRKGMVAKARNAAEAIRMIERGEIDFEDVAGYERKRAEYIHLFKDVITDADFYYNDSNDRIVFGKKYDGGKTGDGYLGVTLQISSNNLGILSFQPKNFTEALLKGKDIKWMVGENSASPIHSTGQLAEKTSGIGTVNITDSGEKSSGGAEYSLAQKPRQQVNPVLSNEDIRREYAEELGRNTYTPETVAEWDRKAVDWITRQGGVAGAVEAILHDTEHNDRHVASLVRRHVMNSDVFAKLDEDSRAKLITHHAFTGTEWGREGVARRLAALTLDSVAKVRALFDKLHADLPDKEKTELRNKVLDETGVDIFKLPKDIADNRRKLDAVLRSELAARSSRGDQLYEFWINSILSGPATHVRNVVGNTLNTAYELGPKRAVEAAINMAVRNPKGATFGEMREMWKHLDWKTAWNRATEAFDLEVLNPSGKYNDHAGVAIGGKKGRIVRVPGRLLRAADEFCKGLIAPVEAAAYAYREGRTQKLSGRELADFINARIKDPHSKSAQWGELRARELAFQEEPGAAIRWLVSLKNSNSPAGKIARFIFPFVQAPGNLLRQGVRKSPLGVASLLAVDLPRAIRSREVTPEMMARAAEQLIAWSTLAALWSAQDDDDDERPLLTGSGAPYGSNERNFKANKFPPLSVRIGDRYYTYKFFEPLSSGLAVIANGLEAMRAKRPAEAKKALVGMSGFIAEKSYLASVKELFEFFQDPEHSGTRFATNFAASWIPNAYRQAVNAFDDKVRDNRTRARGLKYFTDQFDIVTNSAGFTRALPKLDYFGREVDKDAYADSPAGPLMRLLSVQSAAPDRSMDQADRLLWNYNRRNPETAYWPGLPSYYLKQGNRTLYIEGEDYAAFARDAGQLAHKAILSEIRSGSLNVKNPGEEDIKRIKTLFAKARQTAKEKYKGKFHE